MRISATPRRRIPDSTQEEVGAPFEVHHSPSSMQNRECPTTDEKKTLEEFDEKKYNQELWKRNNTPKQEKAKSKSTASAEERDPISDTTKDLASQPKEMSLAEVSELEWAPDGRVVKLRSDGTYTEHLRDGSMVCFLAAMDVL